MNNLMKNVVINVKTKVNKLLQDDEMTFDDYSMEDSVVEKLYIEKRVNKGYDIFIKKNSDEPFEAKNISILNIRNIYNMQLDNSITLYELLNANKANIVIYYNNRYSHILEKGLAYKENDNSNEYIYFITTNGTYVISFNNKNN